MNPIRRIVLLALAAASLLVQPAHAGRNCEQKPLTTEAVTRGMTLAEQTRQALDASGQDLVLLARVGQDLRKYGIHYSHLAFAYRENDGHGGNVWRVLHKLNECGSDTAAIYRQGLGQFFLSDPFRYEAAFVAPVRPIQAALLPVMTDRQRALAMHRRPYSMVSYAWSERYQQSNQWVVETLAASMLPPGASRKQAQGWLMAQAYLPAVLHLSALERLGGRVTAANIAFDDHPPARRYAGQIETITADSVFRWLETTGLGSASVPVRLR
jgi:hypothetical protein